MSDNDIRIVKLDIEARQPPRMERLGGRWVRTGTLRSYESNVRIYVHPEKESIFEQLCFRNDRPRDVYRRVLPDVLEALGLPRDTRCKWSQYAGCSCPCSPGFVVQGTRRLCKDAYVTVAGVEQPVTERAVERAKVIAADPTLAGPLGLESVES